ncbi:hypothetical protein SLE2022_081350 [Rubroshorea leprosula]
MARGPSPKGKPEALEHETVLKFSNLCPCERCKRDVEETLTKIEGVNTVHIDFDKNKVTVKGNVVSKTLIEELKRRKRKDRVFWPEEADQKEERQGKGKSGPKSSSKNRNSTTGGPSPKGKTTLQ